jgi:hypothetical protein
MTRLAAAVANEEHAVLLLKELKADYELIKVREFRPHYARFPPDFVGSLSCSPRGLKLTLKPRLCCAL